MKTLLEENCGLKDEVASTVAAPLDANHVYAPRATLLADPDTAVGLGFSEERQEGREQAAILGLDPAATAGNERGFAAPRATRPGAGASRSPNIQKDAQGGHVPRPGREVQG